MTAPAFVLPTDAEESAELTLLIGTLEKPTSDADLDATASMGLRIMSREQAEIDRYEKALAAEIRIIAATYAEYMRPHRERFAAARGAVEECARRAQFVGKAKSRKVSNGCYGRRLVAESVKIIDRSVLVTWLKNHYPATVHTVTSEVIEHKEVKPLVISHMKMYEGEVAPGAEYTEAHDEPFAKLFSEGGSE